MKNEDLFARCCELSQQGDIKHALTLARKLIKNDPENASIKMQYARLLTYDDNTKERGINMMYKVYNSKDRDKALIELGKQAKQCGDFDQARLYFEELVAMNKADSIYGILELIYLNMLEDKMDVAYNLLMKNYHPLSRLLHKGKLDNMVFHLKYKLNALKDGEEPKTYYQRLLVDYDVQGALGYISSYSHQNQARIKLQVYFKM